MPTEIIRFIGMIPYKWFLMRRFKSRKEGELVFSKMGFKRGLILVLLRLFLLHGFFFCRVWSSSKTHHHVFVIKDASYTRLCKTKNIITVNGQFPGPTLHVHRGDTVLVDVYNHAKENITIHWHGVKQPGNPWSDGPEYVTQCPIQPKASFTYKILFSTEEGTLWWHAHSDWSRATVHGAIVIYPPKGKTYPFPKPHKEFPIILGEWWKSDVAEVINEAIRTGGEPNISDAFTINGHPGDLYPCSKPGTFRMWVRRGKTYLLRLINAGMNNELFFSVAEHRLTVVGVDSSYTKPLNSNFIMITPGQTIDVLLQANQTPNLYYMAARAHSSGIGVRFDNTTTTAILHYHNPHSLQSSPSLPNLPAYNDTQAANSFTISLRSLANKDHPISVPLTVDEHLFFTVSVNTLACPQNSCLGPNGTRLSSSLNNISYVQPSIDILGAYIKHINSEFDGDFPSQPPLFFNFTADNLPLSLLMPMPGTKVKFLKYNTTVELVYQGTNLVAGENHPLHLHGYSFFVVGSGFGNFDKKKDPLTYNFVDPPKVSTVGVPRNGWVAIRFKASNPGVWFMHCHLERHLTWGMDMSFIVTNGPTKKSRMIPPPPNMPPC